MIHQIASAYVNLGLSVIPIRTNGLKNPALDEWDTYKDERPPTTDELALWFGPGQHVGIGVVTGHISGGLEVLDLEDKGGRNVNEQWKQAVVDAGGKDLLEKLVMVRTPSGGMHAYYRCPELIEPGRKVAEFMGVNKAGKPWPLTLIETRGQGHYVVAPGSPPECHPTKRIYEPIHGRMNQIPTITPEQRKILLDAAEKFDEIDRSLLEQDATPKTPRAPRSTEPGNPLLPGDDYNDRGDWESELISRGWKKLRSRKSQKWQKPDDDNGHHATWDHEGSGVFYVFSSNAHPFEGGKSYKPFAIYAMLNHDGDFRLAAEALRSKGFGTPKPERPSPIRENPPTETRITSSENCAIDKKEEPEERESQWGDLIPLFESATPVPLTCDFLPECLQEFSRRVAYVTQTPEDMITSMVVAALSVCAQKKYRVCRRLENNDWEEPVNVWIACSAKSGSRKTEVFNYATKPITEWETDEEIRTRFDRKVTNAKRKLLLKRKKEIESRSGEDDDANVSAHEAARLEEEIPDEALPPLLIDDEGTVEGLEKRFIEYGGRWAFFSDEGGLFEVLAGLYSGGRTNLNVLLKAHPGSDIRVKRSSRESFIKQAALTLGLMVQPGVIENLGKTANFRSTGALARFLYVIPESNLGKRDARLCEAVPEYLKLEYNQRLRRLLDIPYGEPVKLSLSDEALEMFLEFSVGIESLLGECKPLAHIDDWGSKLPGQALRIAALFHLVRAHEYTPPLIEADTLRQALRYASVLMSHALYAFSTMGSDATMSDAAFIARYMVRNKRKSYSERELKQLERFKKTKLENFTRAMDELKYRNIVKGPEEVPGKRGRTSYLWVLNPEALDKGVIDGLVGAQK